MNHELVLLHRPGSERFDVAMTAQLSSVSVSSVSAASFSFETCMRHILLLNSEEVGQVAHLIREGDQVFLGEEAYRFLLEVVCGLHSSLIGETEVYGQLKNQVANYEFTSDPFSNYLQRVFRSLFQDAKQIREKHLKDLGSQSYGSVLRREVRGTKRVHLLGAGHLVLEVLPWLAKDGTEVHVHCRNPEKAVAELPKSVNVHGLNAASLIEAGDAIVIAAPVDAEWIRSWLAEAKPAKLIVDLRADSHVDRVGAQFGRALELGEMLTRITANQAALAKRKNDALAMVQDLSLDRARHTEYRPFGWEDVCA